MIKTEKPINIKEPTKKQKKLAELVVANIGKDGKEIKPLGELVVEAGYSMLSANRPTQITKSETFQALLDRLMPEDRVVKAHNDLIKAGTVQNIELPGEKTDTEIKGELEEMGGYKIITIVRKPGSNIARVYYIQPDSNTRRGAIDMAYKLRGSYAPEKQEIAVASINVVRYGEEKKE